MLTAYSPRLTQYVASKGIHLLGKSGARFLEAATKVRGTCMRSMQECLCARATVVACMQEHPPSPQGCATHRQGWQEWWACIAFPVVTLHCGPCLSAYPNAHGARKTHGPPHLSTHVYSHWRSTTASSCASRSHVCVSWGPPTLPHAVRCGRVSRGTSPPCEAGECLSTCPVFVGG